MPIRNTKRERRYPSLNTIASKRVMSTDRVESIIQMYLDEAGIPYYMGSEPFPECKHLDFYIPSLDTHIECKLRYTDRITKQLSRADNVIYIQSIKSALSFIKLMSLNSNVDVESIINKAIARESICKANHEDLLAYKTKADTITKKRK